MTVKCEPSTDKHHAYGNINSPHGKLYTVRCAHMRNDSERPRDRERERRREKTPLIFRW